MKPKSLFRYVVERAKAELVKRVTHDSTPPPAASPAPPPGDSPSSEASERGQLKCERVSSELVRARWELADSERARAQRALDAPADLAIRCAVFYVDDTGRPRRDVLLREQVQLQGTVEWAVPSDARCVVALGLSRGDEFLAITHEDLTPA